MTNTQEASRRTNSQTHPESYLDEQGRYRQERASPEPPVDGDETATLLGFLERQRATFAWKVGGLDDAGLRARLSPSSMTLGGKLKHLARFEDDTSTEWLLGQQQRAPWNSVDWDAEHDWDWRTAADESADVLYGRSQEAVVRSRAAFAQALADGGIDGQPGGMPGRRYVLLNMIEEYARHNGHADLIRESVDGLVGQDPPG